MRDDFPGSEVLLSSGTHEKVIMGTQSWRTSVSQILAERNFQDNKCFLQFVVHLTKFAEMSLLTYQILEMFVEAISYSQQLIYLVHNVCKPLVWIKSPSFENHEIDKYLFRRKSNVILRRASLPSEKQLS